MIEELAIYLALFYMSSTGYCTSPTDAPFMDLKLMLNIEKSKNKLHTLQMKHMAEALYKKMTNLLWYLSRSQNKNQLQEIPTEKNLG